MDGFSAAARARLLVQPLLSVFRSTEARASWVLEADGEGESMDRRLEAEEGLVAFGRSLKAAREEVVESCLMPAKAGVGILRVMVTVWVGRQHNRRAMCCGDGFNRRSYRMPDPVVNF